MKGKLKNRRNVRKKSEGNSDAITFTLRNKIQHLKRTVILKLIKKICKKKIVKYKTRFDITDVNNSNGSR